MCTWVWNRKTGCVSDNSQHHSMWVRRKAAYLFAQRAQVALEISTCHQLHNHQGWLSLRDHSQQPHLQQLQYSRGQAGRLKCCVPKPNCSLKLSRFSIHRVNRLKWNFGCLKSHFDQHQIVWLLIQILSCIKLFWQLTQANTVEIQYNVDTEYPSSHK